MNKNIENLALKIFEDEEKIKEILIIYEFDVLCDKIKSIEPQINKSEIEEIMKALNENNLSKLSQNDLESISGGKSNAGYKIMASVMAMLIGLSPNLAAEGSVAEASGQGENKPITQKVKDWVSNHKILSLGGAVSVFLTGLFVVRNRHSGKDVVVRNRHSGKDELLGRLPGLWEKFWNAMDAALDAALDAARDAAYDAAWDAANNAALDAARDAALDAARDAVKGAVKDAAWDVAWNTAFANAWEKGGRAYEIVKDYDIIYFTNLVSVLEAQTQKLNDLLKHQQ